MGNPNSENLVVRFSGLYSDPNYYAVGMIISLCLLIVLFHRSGMKPLSAVVFAVPIVYFLIQTYSKSAIIMIVVAIAFLVYSFCKKRNYFVVIVITAATALIAVLAFSGWIPALQTVVERFMASDTAEGMDVSKLTTGRADLWQSYAKHVITNIEVGLFGEGISSSTLGAQPAHNTYLDVFYYLGCAGGSLLFLSLAAILEQSRLVAMKRNFLNYSVLICILIMYFFLSELFYFDPPFQIFLAFTVLNLPNEEKADEHRLKEGA
ncbi:MAG: O-antigen ligase family protein [Clostridia bacterium]|nr:O-antigen ligase family protein [Clostridia bacterium]